MDSSVEGTLTSRNLDGTRIVALGTQGRNVNARALSRSISCSALADSKLRRALLDAASAWSTGEQLPLPSSLDDESKLSLYLAESRSSVAKLSQSLKVGVVFAMWNEVDRLMPASDCNPYGEDCLRVKLEALEWLFSGTTISWHLYAVDDGCPRGSYEVAQQILLELEPAQSEMVTLMRLSDELPNAAQPLDRLEDASYSCKGGSIILGAQRAIADGCDVVIYTDADGSTHLGQIGTFLAAIVENGEAACLGNRYADDATMIHVGGRRSRVMKHVFTALGHKVIEFPDYPSPLKAFRSSDLARILSHVRTFDFMFDYDVVLWLSKLGMPMSRRGYFYVHSAEHSTWNAHSTAAVWHKQIHGLIRLMRLHGHEINAELVRFVEDKFKNPTDIEKALSMHPPPRLVEMEDASIGDLQMYSLGELSAWLEGASAEA